MDEWIGLERAWLIELHRLLKITCIARRFPTGSVSAPDKKHPNGTHNKFIEPVFGLIWKLLRFSNGNYAKRTYWTMKSDRRLMKILGRQIYRRHLLSLVSQWLGIPGSFHNLTPNIERETELKRIYSDCLGLPPTNRLLTK